MQQFDSLRARRLRGYGFRGGYRFPDGGGQVSTTKLAIAPDWFILHFKQRKHCWTRGPARNTDFHYGSYLTSPGSESRFSPGVCDGLRRRNSGLGIGTGFLRQEPHRRFYAGRMGRTPKWRSSARSTSDCSAVPVCMGFNSRAFRLAQLSRTLASRHRHWTTLLGQLRRDHIGRRARREALSLPSTGRQLTKTAHSTSQDPVI